MFGEKAELQPNRVEGELSDWDEAAGRVHLYGDRL